VKSITVTHWKAAALAEIGNVLAPTDPGRATRLIVNAERIAQAITEASDQGFPLTVIVKALAPIDPNRAECIAQTITDELWKARALMAIVQARP
jgi:hypothetical protein